MNLIQNIYKQVFFQSIEYINLVRLIRNLLNIATL